MKPPEKTLPAIPEKKGARAPRGPYRFNSKVANEFLLAIAQGCWMAVAASCAGISCRTVNDWLRRGKDKNGSRELQEFLSKYKKMKHRATRMHIGKLYQAGAAGNTQASQWWLSRVHPEKFGRRDKMELTGKGGKPLVPAVRSVESMTSEEVQRRIEQLEAEAIAAGAVVVAQQEGEKTDDDDDDDDDD